MPAAKADIFEIRSWLMEKDPDHGDRWLWMCSEAITSLREMPKRWPVSVETAAFDVEVRELLFGTKRNVYRVLFSVEETRVHHAGTFDTATTLDRQTPRERVDPHLKIDK